MCCASQAYCEQTRDYFVRKRPTRGGCPPCDRCKNKSPGDYLGQNYIQEITTRVTPPGLSFGGWPGPPTEIVVRITNKLLVYRECADCYAQFPALLRCMPPTRSPGRPPSSADPYLRETGLRPTHTGTCAHAFWRIAKAGKEEPVEVGNIGKARL